VNYRSDADGAEAVVKEITDAGGRAVAVQADVSDLDAADALFERLEEELGPVLVLVNNAGVRADGLSPQIDDEDWAKVIDTNLSAAFRLTRRALRPMIRGRFGRVVNIASIVGAERANPGQANYAASKAGIIGLTKALARELGVRGVRVNAIAPGYITTELTDVLTEEQTSLILGNTPLGRLGSPEDVAAAVRFLCSDEAAFITGDVLLVDGGLGT